MSFVKRSIINISADVSLDEATDLREDWISRLESVREGGDLSAKDINDELDKTDNWYTNHRGGGNHSHDFTLFSYAEVDALLSGESNMDRIGMIAKNRSREWVEELETVRTEIADVSPDTISKALNKPSSWYENTIMSGSFDEISLLSYAEVFVFLETVTMFMLEDGEISSHEIETLYNRGYIRDEFINSVLPSLHDDE